VKVEPLTAYPAQFVLEAAPWKIPACAPPARTSPAATAKEAASVLTAASWKRKALCAA
jgi:hypothetical protein